MFSWFLQPVWNFVDWCVSHFSRDRSRWYADALSPSSRPQSVQRATMPDLRVTSRLAYPVEANYHRSSCPVMHGQYQYTSVPVHRQTVHAQWVDALPLHKSVSDSVSSMPVEVVDPEQFEHRLIERFPFDADVTMFERALMLNQLHSQMRQGCYRMSRLLQHYQCWRKAMQVELDMKEVRSQKHVDARESLNGALWTCNQPAFRDFVAAFPVSMAEKDLVFVTRIGRVNGEYLDAKWDDIKEQTVLLTELLSLGCDAQPGAQMTILHDCAGFHLSSSLGHLNKLITIAKTLMKGHPGRSKRHILFNCSDAITKLYKGVTSHSNPNAMVAMLPFPYDLGRLLELTSLQSLRAHARCQPVGAMTPTIQDRDMSEQVYEAGFHSWVLKSDGEVDFTAYFVREGEVKQLESLRGKEAKGTFRAPQPGLLWLRVVNQSGATVRAALKVYSKE